MLIMSLAAVTLMQAQIPNADFEFDQGKHWKGPAFWYGREGETSDLSTDSYQGDYALRMRAGSSDQPAILRLCADSLSAKKRRPEDGIPFDKLPSSLSGMYKLSCGGGHACGTFRVELILTRTSEYGTDTLSVGDLELPATPVYRPFRVRIQNLGGRRLPDRLHLRFITYADCEGNGADCSELLVDALSFEPTRKNYRHYRPKPPVSVRPKGYDPEEDK